MKAILRILVFPALAMVGFSSCESESASTSIVSVRDSAGVRIVDFSQPIARRRLAEQPFVRIGQAEGVPEHELFRVKSAFLTDDGRVVLANSGTLEIRIFDDTGRHLQTIGGLGEGPGEFQSLDWVEKAEDGRLVALDIELRRITIFGPAGELVSTLGFREGPGYPFEGPLILPDGRLLLRWVQDDPFSLHDEESLRPGAVVPYPMVLTSLDPTDGVVDTVAVVDGGDVAIWESENGGASFGSPWFGPLTTYAVGGDGIFIGTQRANEILRLGLDGELEEIVRGPEKDLTVSREFISSYEQTRLTMAPSRIRDDPEMRRRVLEGIRERPFAQTKPAYGRILLGPDRELWISEWTIQGVLPRVWTVVDVESGGAEQVTVPERFELFQVGHGFLLGRSTDELGVETIVGYELESAA